ncbi:thioredoxin-dependent thiol peroxidase [uncultured Phascolarctobacterium sp.]|uniref:thioredoxin-dependent thiol peroxidase n=1 Tax=uncultured Phascolarctobacterium sp. TaxID=512296 RepID=UPI0025F64E75|nr:thioredoxin-dependent thiol peroxidase [uncultured Phascolarctobacterium sp.]
MLEVGSVAPAFTLPDKDGNSVSLSDFAGKKVVLYFYPKDSTPGCTRQAQAFRDAFAQFAAEGAVIIGISKDSVKSHFNFAAKQELPFILLSDTEKEVLQAYEVWQEKKLYGKVSMGVVRSVYVIDEDGKIAAAWTKVKPEQSAADALAFVCSCNK